MQFLLRDYSVWKALNAFTATAGLVIFSIERQLGPAGPHCKKAVTTLTGGLLGNLGGHTNRKILLNSE